MSQDDNDNRDTRPRAGRRPQDFSPEEKLQIVQQASQLQDSKLGPLLRR